MSHDVSRRRFFGGVAAALGLLGVAPGDVLAQAPAGAAGGQRNQMSPSDFDSFARLNNNENNYGPPEAVMKAMNGAFKYSNRYGYPDGNIVQEIARHHGVKPENILLTAGSGEVLDVVGTTFLTGKKVLGVEPSYSSVYQHATSIKSTAVKLPLGKDYRQDMAALIKTANARAGELGFVYLCNPNNPTGMIVTKAEVKQLLDGIPAGMPVLIDEAYHHFVDDPNYATSVPYVIEGRPVIVARTFSKIAALAGMRLGYAVSTRELVDRMKPYSMGSINALVKWGGAASLKDTAGQADVKKRTIDLRKKVSAELVAYGYEVLPSEANFFMVHVGREVPGVIEDFRAKKVMVGRPFPPMTQHLRVSVGTPAEMEQFTKAFKEIFPQKTRNTAAG